MTPKERKLFLQLNGDRFRQEEFPVLTELLEDADMSVVSRVNLIKPAYVVLVSIFLGQFGADRFMLDDKKSGVLKLSLLLLYYGSVSVLIADTDNSLMTVFFGMSTVLSAIGVCLFWIYDVITSSRRARIRNFNTFAEAVGYTSPDRPKPESNPESRYNTQSYNNNYNTSTRGSYQK